MMQINPRKRWLLIFLLFGLPWLWACAENPAKKKEPPPPPVTFLPDTPFFQESRAEYLRHDVEGYFSETPQPPNEIFAVAVLEGRPHAGGPGGLQFYDGQSWTALLKSTPIYSLLAVDDRLYAGAEDGVFTFKGSDQNSWSIPDAGPIRALAFNPSDGKFYAGAETGLFYLNGDTFVAFSKLPAVTINDLLVDPEGAVWVASSRGLFQLQGQVVYPWTTEEYLLSEQVNGLALDEQGNLWIGTSRGLNVLTPDQTMFGYTGTQGLPYLDIRSVVYQPTGGSAGVWLGTPRGVIRYANEQWNYYAGRRWIPNDIAYDLAVDDSGGIWAATDNGLSRLAFDQFTLLEKAEYYRQINVERHNRYGLVSACDLDLPGDLNTFRLVDSDNDGLWTGMYVAALSFEYAVTGDPAVRQMADEHFAAMAFLEEVTGIPGLPARSIAPLYSKSQDPDCYPNCQWRANPDAGWDWKSDTSSDEITGHFYAYAAYYDLAAQGEQKQKVIELVWRIADYILSNDYFLIDWDGQPTTWGVWNPDYLWYWYKLPDPQERERYLGLIYPNSLEIISYMRTAYHITGDPRFLDAYNSLVYDYALADLALNAELYFPMITNHSTNELLFLSYYPLLRYEQDQTLRAKYFDSLRRSWDFVSVEHSSFFDITFGALTEGQEDFDLPAAADNLREIPLDLADWRMENSQRADVKIDLFPNRFGQKLSDTTQPPLPPDERPMMIWNGDPFVLDGGGIGTSEEAGTFWLLPYWMGRYHQFIGADGE